MDIGTVITIKRNIPLPKPGKLPIEVPEWPKPSERPIEVPSWPIRQPAELPSKVE